jgi:hypothetical protein
MVVMVNLKRTEYANIKLDVDSLDEAKEIMADGVFDEDDVEIEYNWDNDWEVDGIDEIAFRIIDLDNNTLL